MTRKDYEEMVKGPGKFEGEPSYTPYFYDQCLDGFGETVFHSGVEHTFFEIEHEDLLMFPELFSVYGVSIFEDSSGFVYLNTYDSKDQYEAVINSADGVSGDVDYYDSIPNEIHFDNSTF